MHLLFGLSSVRRCRHFLPRHSPPTVKGSAGHRRRRRRHFRRQALRRDSTMCMWANNGQHLPADCLLIWYNEWQDLRQKLNQSFHTFIIGLCVFRHSCWMNNAEDWNYHAAAAKMVWPLPPTVGWSAHRSGSNTLKLKVKTAFDNAYLHRKQLKQNAR